MKKIDAPYDLCYLQYIQFSIRMMNLFRSTQQKKLFKLLESHGFNSQDFKEFKIGDLAKQVTTRDFLSPLQQIIREHKMTHLKLLKTSLLTLHIIQISEKVEQNPFLGEIIRQLQIRTRTALRFSSKTANKSYVINEKKEHPEDEGGHHTTKQFYDSSCVQSPENVELNSVSYLLGKLVLPLLHIQEKILYCHELIYRPKVEMNSETCWATINLLKKFSELSQSIQQIGRYYKQLVIPIVCTIRVLSLDIRILYRRVTNYLKKQCAELQLTIESKNSSVIQIFQEEKMKEVIMLVQQLQKINQNVRLLYCNKYFSDMLVLNNIFMPSIFSTGQENLELLYSFLEYRTKMPNSFTISGLLHPPILRTNNSLEMVQNV